jgi:hypothetical protein
MRKATQTSCPGCLSLSAPHLVGPNCHAFICHAFICRKAGDEKITAMDGCGRKRDDHITVRGETNEPDCFAPWKASVGRVD